MQEHQAREHGGCGMCGGLLREVEMRCVGGDVAQTSGVVPGSGSKAL